MNTKWIEYEPNLASSFTPVHDWGKDHWSTFAYAAACVTGREGLLENARMRTNARLHRELAHTTPFGTLVSGEYPTILKLGVLEKHDDWSCLEDATAYGLIKVFYKRVNDKPFGCCVAKVELTDKGWEVARKLSEHKAIGRSFAEFESGV